MVSLAIAAYERTSINLDRTQHQRITIGAHAHVTIYETVVPKTQETSLEIFVQAHAQVTLIQETQQAHGAISLQHTVVLEDHAQFFWYGLYKNVSGTVHMDVHMVGTQAQASGNCLVMVEHTDALALHTRQLHEAPHARSSMNIKTLAYDASSFAYKGTIAVEEQALGTYATQYNKNLSMGTKTLIKSEPYLEVKTDAVQCKHGSAVAYIDEEHLFYLQSKGLEHTQAERMLQRAFSAEIIGQLPDHAMQAHWYSAMTRNEV